MRPFDLVVVGGGMGGLAAAGLAQSLGMRVALVEAHNRLGGCAGWFDRGPYTFDAGATALMGMGPIEPIGALLRKVGLPFSAEKTPAYRVHLPSKTLDIVDDAPAFEAASHAAFPGHPRAQRLFWRLQALVGNRLFHAAGDVPRMPLRTFGDLAHDLRILGMGGALAAATSLVCVKDALHMLGLAGDTPFTALVAMLLQDTAQAGPETVPFANAAACLQAYRLGMSRPKGGMKALAEGLGGRFAATGGDLRTSTIVDRVVPATEGGRIRRRDQASRPPPGAPGRLQPADRPRRLASGPDSGRGPRSHRTPDARGLERLHRLCGPRPHGRARRRAAVSPGPARSREAPPRRQ